MNMSKENMRLYIEDRLITVGVVAVMGALVLAVLSCITGLIFSKTSQVMMPWNQIAFVMFATVAVGFSLIQVIRFVLMFFVASLQEEKWGEVIGYTADEPMDGHYGIVRDKNDKHPYNTGVIHLSGHEQVWLPGVKMPYFTIGNRCYVNVFHKYTA